MSFETHINELPVKMSSETHFNELPIELVESIISIENLGITDIINFSMTCKYFSDIVNNSNNIWRSKFMLRWPRLKYLCEQNESDNWLEHIQACYMYRKKAMSRLLEMSPKFYRRQELSELDLLEWREELDEHPFACDFILNLLMEIVHAPCQILTSDVVPLEMPGNLTLKFYGTKALRFVRQEHLMKQWNAYLQRPPGKQVLEHGAVIVAQWCQPDREVTNKSVSDHLDTITQRVLTNIVGRYPNHPVLKASDKDREYWKENVSNNNIWNPVECKQIIEVIGYVMFTEMGFMVQNDMYMNDGNLVINEVLHYKVGYPMVIGIIYESVARRLGVKCECIPAHFLVRWIEDYRIPNEPFYVDLHNNGTLYRRGTCPYSNPNKKNCETIPAKQVIECLVQGLVSVEREQPHPDRHVARLRSIWELNRFMNPYNMSCALNLAKLYMLYNMECRLLIDALQVAQTNQCLDEHVKLQAFYITHLLQDHEAHNKNYREPVFPKIKAKNRTGNVKYAVGMIMVHIKYNYRCVIYGWDPVCKASPEWQFQMDVQSLANEGRQPFYNVLTDDGSHRYAAQENLIPDTRVANDLAHLSDIGSHFSHYYHKQYVPNTETKAEYPTDCEVRKGFLRFFEDNSNN